MQPVQLLVHREASVRDANGWATAASFKSLQIPNFGIPMEEEGAEDEGRAHPYR